MEEQAPPKTLQDLRITVTVNPPRLEANFERGNIVSVSISPDLLESIRRMGVVTTEAERRLQAAAQAALQAQLDAEFRGWQERLLSGSGGFAPLGLLSSPLAHPRRHFKRGGRLRYQQRRKAKP